MLLIAWRIAAGLALSITLASGALWAQEPGKLPRIGVLWPGDVEPYNKAFLDGLGRQGYVHAVTALIDIRSTGPNIESGAKLAEELVALDPAVIYAVPDSSPLSPHQLRPPV